MALTKYSLIRNALLLLTCLKCYQTSNDFDTLLNFDDELYYNTNEINPNDYGRTAAVSQTTMRLFQPCVDENESVGILTRISDCAGNIVFDTLYHKKSGHYYKMGCCQVGEELVDDYLTKSYDNFMRNLGDNSINNARNVRGNRNFKNTSVSMIVEDGTKCVTSASRLKGIQMSHQRCKSLIGYIEKGDRNLSKPPIAHGCCPVKLSGEKYFESIKEAKKFKHQSCRLNNKNQSCKKSTCLTCENPTSANLPVKTDYPYLAKIGHFFKTGYQWTCGGAIISSKYILTTSNCIGKNRLLQPKIAAIGSNVPITSCCSEICRMPASNFSSRVSQCACCQQLIGIKQLISYAQDDNSYYDDIGLVELEFAIIFTSYIYPAILPQSWYYPIRNLTTTQFCRDNPTKHDHAVTMMNSRDCTEYFKLKNIPRFDEGFYGELQYCARLKWSENFCENGNPLVLTQISKNDVPMYILHGLSSFVNYESARNKIIVYTRIFSYLTWIEQKVWP